LYPASEQGCCSGRRTPRVVCSRGAGVGYGGLRGETWVFGVVEGHVSPSKYWVTPAKQLHVRVDDQCCRRTIGEGVAQCSTRAGAAWPHMALKRVVDPRWPPSSSPAVHLHLQPRPRTQSVRQGGKRGVRGHTLPLPGPIAWPHTPSIPCLP